MDEYVKWFSSLLQHVPYMQEEKAKIQRFISSLPNFMKEKLEFDYPRMMDNAVRKARICYQQMEQKNEGPKGAIGKKMRNLPPNRQPKVINGRNNQQITLRKFASNPPIAQTYIKNRQPERVSKPATDQPPKAPLQCWGYGDAHYYKNCPHKA